MDFSDWLKDSSNFTNKQAYTYSEVSRSHFLSQFLGDSSPQHEKFKANPLRKEKNKANSKHYRERQKSMHDQLKREIEGLREENNFLKSQKFCRYCKRQYSHNVLFCQASQKV